MLYQCWASALVSESGFLQPTPRLGVSGLRSSKG